MFNGNFIYSDFDLGGGKSSVDVPKPHVALSMQSACFEFGFAQPMVRFSCSGTSKKNYQFLYFVPEYWQYLCFHVDLHKTSSCGTILWSCFSLCTSEVVRPSNAASKDADRRRWNHLCELKAVPWNHQATTVS